MDKAKVVARCPECGDWAIIVSVHVLGFQCMSCGERYPSLRNLSRLLEFGAGREEADAAHGIKEGI